MNLNRIFKSETKTITFAAILVGFSSGVSAILGLVRDRLLAARFGAGEELDIYFAAFRIPDFVYGILVVGGLTAAFLPIFAEYFEKNNSQPKAQQEEGKNLWPENALELANNILNSFAIFLILLCGILFIFTPIIMNLVVPGFSLEQKNLTVVLTRIMFLSPILLCVSSLFSGILQYFNRFLVYSLAPIFYNLGIIIGIIFFVPVFGIPGLAYGVILGAFLHLAIQIPSVIDAGFKYRPFFNPRESGLLKIFKLIIPRVIGQASYHLNLVVITAIASTLSIGSIAIFNFSNNIQSLPITIIGVSFAIAAFPMLSRAWANHHKEQFFNSFFSALRQIIFLIAPFAVLMFILRAQLIRLILGTGQFGWLETRLTAASIGLFTVGILANSLIPLIARAFFSLKDTKTPVAIGIISMGLNIAFALLFINFLREPIAGYQSNIFRGFLISFLKLYGIKNIEVIALPLALSLSSTVQFILLSVFLYKKIKTGNHLESEYKKQNKEEILTSLKKIAFSSLLTVIFTYFSLKTTASFVDMRSFFGVFWQTIITLSFGGFVYILSAYLLKIPELKIIKSSILKQFSPDA